MRGVDERERKMLTRAKTGSVKAKRLEPCLGLLHSGRAEASALGHLLLLPRTY